MKSIAIFAALIPWLVFWINMYLYKSGLASIETVKAFDFLWVFLSPMWFAAGCLVAYRHGQWSVKD